MGFNLNRRCTPVVLDSIQTDVVEKQLKETKSSRGSILSVVDVDTLNYPLPDYDAFPLEAQLASGVPLQQINPSVLSDVPENVESAINHIISDSPVEKDTTDNN